MEAQAEDLPAAATGTYRLVTFGSSIWWTDAIQVAETVYDMLEPGGALALVKHQGGGPTVPPSPEPPPIPHAEIEALVRKYLGSTKRAGHGARPAYRAEEDVIANTRFGSPQVIIAPGIPDLVRDTESVLAGYFSFSFSFSAPHLFGDQVEAFATEVRDLLRARPPEGLFWDWPGDTQVILARK